MRVRWQQTLYGIVYPIFFLLTLPYYFIRLVRRGNWKEGLLQRFGYYSSRIKSQLTNRKVVWVHGVSVGEVKLAVRLIEHLASALPGYHFVISTTTTTGMEILKSRVIPGSTCIYFPLDFRSSVRRAIRTINPRAVILIEAEIWPNFIWAVRRRQIPIFLANARISDRSYRRYMKARAFFRAVFRAFTWVGTQDEHDARRLLDLGFRPEAVHVVGSMKYDTTVPNLTAGHKPEELLGRLGVSPGCLIIVGGSTHQGEEEALARAYKVLKPKYPNLFLILVPRHFERGKEIGERLAELGIRFVFRRAITAYTHYAPGEVDCLLVNTTGELVAFYSVATVVFIGKSLYGRGGQNPIEPAALSKPVVFGPYMDNFKKVAEEFLSQHAAIVVHNEEQLVEAFDRLLSSEEFRRQLGERALEVVRRNQGALVRTAEAIVSKLRPSNADQEVAKTT